MMSFFTVPSVPTNSCLLFTSAEEAITYPCGEIDLGFCNLCGFISNMAFDGRLTEYSGRYEETQGYSATFQKFHQSLAERLLNKYDLNNKQILEIGCGKGEFLTLLCELGDNAGVGFDPGYDGDRLHSDAAERLTFIKDFYTEQNSSHSADFVCCKMTLEHIHQPANFIRMVRAAIGEDLNTIVFFQVPEAMRIIENCAFEDIYYEHCSYFTAGSLGKIFRDAGFEILDISTEYNGQYLTIEAKPCASAGDESRLPIEEDIDDLRALIASFPERCNQKLDEWRGRLAEFDQDDKKIALWGSGSKAVSFLTTLDPDGLVKYVVDINPHRHNHFMPGTGQIIVSPDSLQAYAPDAVIIMNRVYEQEISADLNAMGLSPVIYTL